MLLAKRNAAATAAAAAAFSYVLPSKARQPFNLHISLIIPH
jgi:hypothetical protein